MKWLTATYLFLLSSSGFTSCKEILYFNYPKSDQAITYSVDGETIGRMTYKITDKSVLVIMSEWIRGGDKRILRDLYSSLFELHPNIKKFDYGKSWRPAE